MIIQDGGLKGKTRPTGSPKGPGGPGVLLSSPG